MSFFQTPPLSIIDLPADEQHSAGLPLVPSMIVIHATGGTDSRAWLTTNPASNVSVHRLIMKDGTIYKLVDDLIQAHHVGGSRMGNEMNLNDRALGIELENRNTGRDPYPAAQLTACAKQVAEWYGRFGFLPIVSHARVDTEGKTDPAGFKWAAFHALLQHEIAAAISRTGVPSADTRASLTRLVQHLSAAQNEAGILNASVILAGGS